MMLDLLLSVMRYLFLALFYLFLFKLVLAIFRDLRAPVDAVRSNVENVESDVSSIRIAPDSGGDGAKLIFLSDTNELSIPLGNNTLIGRLPGCHIRINENYVSGKHAIIKYRSGQYWVEDLDSLNGTYLNGTRLTKPAVLANGDLLRIGGASFEFVRWAYEVEPNK